MILLHAGEVDSCLYNSERMYKRIFDFKESNLQNEKLANDGGGNMSLRWNKSDTYHFVNVGLVLVKCLLLKSVDLHRKQAAEVLAQCLKVLKDGLVVDTKDLKSRMLELYKDKIENQNV